MNFKLHTEFSPGGDQPEAIDQLVDGIRRGAKHQTLLGVTGSGKTFTMANVIERVQMPVLVISHNKTLAAQLYHEFKTCFPENAVEYFVSFYDYYQPEAYIPSTDTYIEKDSQINDEIDRLRLKATSSLMSRTDVIIVASVSCIYNIGSPEAYADASRRFRVGESIPRKELLTLLVDMYYKRNNAVLERGTFRVRGDTVELQPAYEEHGLRFEFFGDELERISFFKTLDGTVLYSVEDITVFPAKHYVTTRVTIEQAIAQIQRELNERLGVLRAENKLLEAQRLEQRTLYDMEMLREVGFVSGIENYSRILDGRQPGSTPHALIEFFNRPFLTIIDESHVTIPQIRGMYNGDRARKETLVEHGFRLPCALDNRPLRFEEFTRQTDIMVYVSATPADYELEQSGGVVTEQVIRPTGLVDPVIEVRPARSQVDDLIEQLRQTVENGQRALVTTLTKRMAEDLSEYLVSLDFRVRYLHSDIDTLARSEILRDLRLGEFDVLVGINLLREGLDLPEVALVAILDADKEGFLRSARSLIQIAGRAARNIEGRIILYADAQTDSIRTTLRESGRRRRKQLAYNEKHGIVPRSVERKIERHLSFAAEENETLTVREPATPYGNKSKTDRAADLKPDIAKLEKEMHAAAKELDFEKAARLRDEINELKERA